MSFVLAPELRELLGDLRGHDPPADDTLRRLREMNPNYRITWTHPTPDRVVGGMVYNGRPGLWWLHELRPNNPHDELRKRAAAARLDRYNSFGDDRKQKNLGTPAQCEDTMNGYWSIGSWPEVPLDGVPRFGSEGFFGELRESERIFREEARRLEMSAAMDAAADEETLNELDENAEFRAYLSDGYRQIAMEDWALIFAGRHGVRFATTLKTVKESIDNAGANGQQVDGPGQARSDRESGQHPTRHISGEGRGKAEVRADDHGPRQTGAGSDGRRSAAA